MTRPTEALAAAQQALANAHAMMMEIRAEILRGDSTGDPIKDFLIVYAPRNVLDGTSAPIEARYRELSERLKGKSGQFVFMIERDLGHPDSSPLSTPPIREAFTLGVLVDDRLRFELQDDLPAGTPSWTFPTEQYGKRGDHQVVHGDGRPIQVMTGGMHPWFEAIFYMWLDEALDFRDHAYQGLARFSLGVDPIGPITRLDFFIGNDEIEAWCHDLRLYPTRASAEALAHRTVNPRRVAMICDLAEAIGVDPTTILSVKSHSPAR